MIAGTVWTSLKTTLENDPTLNKYVKRVYEGRRYDVGRDSLPCLMLEPVSDGEALKEFGNIKDMVFRVDIFAFTYNSNSKDGTIISKKNSKGILNINNDVRACLQSSNTLGEFSTVSVVRDVRFDATQFDTLEIDKFEVRGALISISIVYI